MRKSTGFGIGRYLDVFWASQLYAWKSLLVYRTQFIIAIVQTFLSMFANFILITVIYNVSRGIPGWSYYQLLLLVALAGTVANAVSYFAQPRSINSILKDGVLDTYLTKPYNPAFLLIARSNSLNSFTLFIWNLILFGYAASHLQISLLNVLPFLALNLFGVVAWSAFILFLGVVAYRLFVRGWWTGTVVNLINQANQYPLNIYGFAGMLIFTLLVPIGLAIFYPAVYLFTGISVPLLLLFIALELAVTVFFFRAFEHFLKGYTSAMG